MLAKSRLSEPATCIRLARMRRHAKISGSELLLSVIAIRLAALGFVGWGLTLLPRQPRDAEPACVSSTTRTEPPAMTTDARVADAAFEDMRLHD